MPACTLLSPPPPIETLHVVVHNRSDEDQTVGYRYRLFRDGDLAEEGSSGSRVPPCAAVELPLEVEGEWVLTGGDRELATWRDRPSGSPSREAVATITFAPDGTPSLAELRYGGLEGVEPDLVGAVPLLDCR